jgi:hypothetical protein
MFGSLCFYSLATIIVFSPVASQPQPIVRLKVNQCLLWHLFGWIQKARANACRHQAAAEFEASSSYSLRLRTGHHSYNTATAIGLLSTALPAYISPSPEFRASVFTATLKELSPT